MLITIACSRHQDRALSLLIGRCRQPGEMGDIETGQIDLIINDSARSNLEM